MAFSGDLLFHVVPSLLEPDGQSGFERYLASQQVPFPKLAVAATQLGTGARPVSVDAIIVRALERRPRTRLD